MPSIFQTSSVAVYLIMPRSHGWWRKLIGSAVTEQDLNHPLTIKGEVSSLTIDFQHNKLVTVLSGATEEIKLSNALGISMDLYEIFSRYVDDLSTKEIELCSAFEVSTSTELKQDGKTCIAIYPNVGRVVLTTSSRQSSVPLSTLKALAPLFQKAMIDDLCPTLDETPSAFNLLKSIRFAYIGLCMVGAAKAWQSERFRKDKCLQEFARTVYLLQGGHAFFTEPWL